MDVTRTRCPRDRTVSLALAALLVGGASLPAAAQVRPELGVSLTGVAGFDGNGMDPLDGDAGLGVEAAVALKDAWRLAAVGRWSSHGSETSLPSGAEVWTVAGELQWRPPVRGWTVRPHLGIRGGLGVVDYDTSALAVLEIDLIPGTRVVEDDSGPYLAPELGVRIPLSPTLVVDVDAIYAFYEVDPVIVPFPYGDEGWSRGASLEATVVAIL